MRYVPALDGLRAVAILGVLVFHLMPGTLRGGFTGVDVFFVLSGYLITSVILYDVRVGHFTMREFYLRRIQRLVPNATVTILATAALAAVLLPPFAAAKVAEHGLFTLFNLSNFYIWRSVGGYWGDSAARVPLLHTWSLSVEEQFYLVFPLALVFLSRRRAPHMALALLALASFGLCVYGTLWRPTASFYLLPTRAWELLAGSTYAAYEVSKAPAGFGQRSESRLCRRALGWGGLALIAFGYLFITDENQFPGTIALIPTLGSLGVIFSVSRADGGIERLLSTPLAVQTGKRSYSLYLWHWPLMVIGRAYAAFTDQSERAGQMIGGLGGVVLALVAYRIIERPLRARGVGRQRRVAIVSAAFAATAISCLALLLRHPDADALNYFDRLTFRGGLYNVGEQSRFGGGPWGMRGVDVLYPPRLPRPSDIWRSGGVIHPWGKGKPRVVVLGSSHALMYAGLIDDICRKLGVTVAFLSADGSSAFFPTTTNFSFPTVDLARDFDSARRRWIGQWNPDALVVVDRWDNYPPATLDANLRALANEFGSHTRHIIVPSQIPALRIGAAVNLREMVAWKLRTTRVLPTLMPDLGEPIRRGSLKTIELIASAFPKVELLELDQHFYNQDGSIRFSSGRQFLYIDDNHLSDAGVELVREAWTHAIATAVGSTPPFP